jgi:hypothetical protein
LSKNIINETEYFISVEDKNIVTQGLACDMCNLLLRKKDFDTVQKYGVCLDCKVDFVEYDMEGWDQGIRPDSDYINKKIKARLDNPFFFMRDRPI